MAKHKAPRPPGPRHLTRLRLSLLVKMLEFERTTVSTDELDVIEPREWWTRREQLLIATGRREPA